MHRDILEPFAVTLLFLLVGVVLKRIPAIPEKTGSVLNSFVIYVSLPALILLKVPELAFTEHLLVPALMPWGMLLFSALLVLILSRRLHWDRPTTGCLLLLIPLGNTSFLGIPMVKAFFGDRAISYALLYDQVGSFLALATYGSLVLAAYGSSGTRPTPLGVAKRVLSFPPFVALILAFGARSISWPPVAAGFLEMLAATLVPLVMIAVGFQLTLQLSRRVTSQLSLGLSIKLIVAPAVALIVCRLTGLQGEAVQVSIFEAGMPPMVSAGALAMLANLSPSLTAALVGIGIVASFVTLPVLYLVLS